jgi:hypothetical protein
VTDQRFLRTPHWGSPHPTCGVRRDLALDSASAYRIPADIEANEVVNPYLNSAAGNTRNAFRTTRSPLLKTSVKEIDEYVTNGLAAHVAPAPSPDSIVEPVADTDDDKDSNVEMIDNDGDKDNEVNENGAKTTTIEPVKETPFSSPSVIRIVARWSPKDFDTLNKSSRDDFNRRIAPILSAVHTTDHPC